eukprot:GHVU01039206.1.p1 GENE.GHVU01039206.1~~GHVU01039206.1.p1  ORF type:complete len:398 (+),score=48.90 GHVU01039206.1:322-1515(+)
MKRGRGDVAGASMGSTGSVHSRMLRRLDGHKGPVMNVRFNKDGNYCLTCGHDKALRLWNPHKGLMVKEYKGPHNHEVNDLTVADDNSKFLSVGGDRVAFLWDVAAAKVIRKFVGHEGKLHCCAAVGDFEAAVTGSYDKAVRIFDLKAHGARPVHTITDARDVVTALLVADSQILTGSLDGHVRTYDIRAGRVVDDNLHHPIISLALSSDGRCLVAGGQDSTVRLIETQTGQLLNSFCGHKSGNYLLAATFDPTDSLAVSGSEDGHICFWDVCGPKHAPPVETIRAPQCSSGATFCVRYNTDGTVMLSTGSDGALRVWGVPEKKEESEEVSVVAERSADVVFIGETPASSPHIAGNRSGGDGRRRGRRPSECDSPGFASGPVMLGGGPVASGSGSSDT